MRVKSPGPFCGGAAGGGGGGGGADAGGRAIGGGAPALPKMRVKSPGDCGPCGGGAPARPGGIGGISIGGGAGGAAWNILVNWPGGGAGCPGRGGVGVSRPGDGLNICVNSPGADCDGGVTGGGIGGGGGPFTPAGDW